MGAAEKGVRYKVIEADLRTNRMDIIEGDQDFYGRPLDEHGQVTPQHLVDAIHPADTARMIETIERSAQLKDGETNEYVLRARHIDGHWILATSVARVISRDAAGRPHRLRIEVEMRDLEDGQVDLPAQNPP